MDHTKFLAVCWLCLSIEKKMFGSLRLFLAMAVALSHVNVSLHGHNIGVMAVVVFFLLSGYVVAGLLSPGLSLSRSPLKFFIERGVRLLPLYYTFLMIGALIALSGSAQSIYLNGGGDTGQWLANLLIIPLNYSMFSQSLGQFLLIPPAWSLGLEIQYYLLAPWLMRYISALFICMVGSFVVSVMAHSGLIHTDWFGYRMLCGNLFIFLSGAWLYRMRYIQANRLPIIALWCACFVLWCVTGLLGKWSVPYTFEVLTGYLLGVPLVAWLGHKQRKPWDETLGHLAYGVFLCHFAVLWLAPQFGLISLQAEPLWLYLALVLMTAFWGHVLVERRLIALRQRLR